MDTDIIIKEFYDARREDERFNSKHGAVEYIITRHYIGKYLRPGNRILEVGCGTGRYALHYTHAGYEVDALDLVESNLDVFRQKIGADDIVRPVQGNALDLSRYPDASFDVTLVLGPMYHLFTEADKRQCLSEAVRVTKPGGHLFVAYCQFDASMIQAAFLNGMHDFLTEHNLLDATHYLPISNPDGTFELYRKEWVDALTTELPVQRLHYVGTDMFAGYHAEAVDAMDAQMYERFLAYTLSICENPHLVGVSNHALDILRVK